MAMLSIFTVQSGQAKDNRVIPLGVVAKVHNCNIVVSEFEL